LREENSCGQDAYQWLRLLFHQSESGAAVGALASGAEASSSMAIAKLGGRN
jgi:hypothetical protein